MQCSNKILEENPFTPLHILNADLKVGIFE